jgi:PUA domain protein
VVSFAPGHFIQSQPKCSRSREHLSIYTVHNEPIVFQHFDGPLYPTLRLLHKCIAVLIAASQPFVINPTDPYILPKVVVDRGAIRFLLAGAAMMAPGFTSKGGWLPPPEEAVPVDAAVAIHAEGKEHAMGIGITKMGTEDIKKVTKGVAVDTTTYLGDDLWALPSL